jgi:class 3 adenylate cyclase
VPTTVMQVVHRWGGHVAKYLGDGVLAYFGWPQAHEDDAERAVRAGLELTQAVDKVEDGAGYRLAGWARRGDGDPYTTLAPC